MRKRAFVFAAVAAALLVVAAPAMATTSLAYKATLEEPFGGPNQSPFPCPLTSGMLCGSGNVIGLGQVSDVLVFGGGCGGGCDLRTTTFADGSSLVLEETLTFHNPGRSGTQPALAHGHPFVLALTDVVDGSLSTGRFAGASGTMSGRAMFVGGVVTTTIAGTITLA